MLSHDELSAAADADPMMASAGGATESHAEEVPPEPPATDVKPPEAAEPPPDTPPAEPPDDAAAQDHKEKSALGRKLAEQTRRHEAELAELREQNRREMADLRAKIEAMSQKPPAEEDDPYRALTKTEALDLIRQERESAERQAATAEAEYNRVAWDRFARLTVEHELTDDEYAAVKEKFVSPGFYKRMHGDPRLDSEANFMAAQNAVLREQLEKARKPPARKNPLEGKPPEAPLGASVGTASGAEVRDADPKLDPETAAYVAARGLKPEFVRRVLGAK